MNSNLKKANQALLEGDRDSVLELLENASQTPEVLWLRANSVLSDTERIEILRQLAGGAGRYSQLAGEFLDRELKIQKALDEPPDYKFWKQPTWEKKMEKMRAYRMWVFGGILLIVLAVVGVIANNKNREEYEIYTEGVKATQTAQAYFAGKQFAEYPSGTLSIIDFEDSVNQIERPVTFGETQDNQQYKPVDPAQGARFVAVRIDFKCAMAICENPPEADLRLLLADETYTRAFNYSSRAFFIDEPPTTFDRIANGQSVKLWFVFEVPRITSPKGLIVVAPNVEEPLIVSWPVH